MSVQQFCLRWNNHQPNFISVFSTLLHNETLVDVTLAAEGKQLQAHKVVLSACSSYFQSLFTSNPCQHPIVILKDVQYNHLKTMVDFMYYGEVNVSQEQLPHILKTAEMLKIKGLAEMPDATSLTKSESKTSLEHQDQIQSSIGSGDWVSTESQQQFHQQQQQQHHHQQHQQRRTPSPGSTSPSTRRKRLRKSSTGSGSASTERTSEEQSSIEGGSNINMSQIDSMATFGSSVATNIGNTRTSKESSSIETETVHHESSQESVDESNVHHSTSNVMKSDGDIGNVSQTMPLDITGSSTPGNQTPCPQSQSATMGSKRGRLLIRQPRVKKESDPIIGHSSPDIDLEHSAYITTTTTTRYLQIPPKIERHASEPAPSTITLLSPNLLSVPQPSFLVKQHSHPVLPSQSQSPPQTTYTLQRQLSYPVTSTSAAAAITTTQLSSDNTIGISSQLAQLVATSIKTEEGLKTKPISPTVVIVTDPMTPTSEHNMPSIRVKTEELQRSISTPQTITRELSIENPRSSHCPILRDGPALGCNFCWNTIDGHGRILRRKTKYHCPECQTNLCIVPCFQEYHERQANDITNNENNTKTSATATLRHYPKTGSL